MKTVKYTLDQQKIIDMRGSDLLVSAAAGSGKTAVLTARILSLVTDREHPVDIDHFLIVTFTKAAAAEMRERIGAEMQKRLLEDPEDENMQRQLTLLHNAQITTIDSFCLFVIKNHFASIQLDPGFRTMDEGERKLMMRDILTEMFEEHYERHAAGEDPEFVHLIECYQEKGRDTELHDQILTVYELAMSHPFPKEWLMEAAQDYDSSGIAEIEAKKWWQEGVRICDMLLEEAASRAAEGIRLCQLAGGPAPYLQTMQALSFYVKELLAAKDYGKRYRILKNMDVPPFGTVTRKMDVDPEYKRAVKELRDGIKGRLDEIREDFYACPLEEMLRRHNYIGCAARELVCLTDEFRERFHARKREQNLIDFTDMEHFALEILVSRDAQGQVHPTKAAQEYRDYFEHVMVDEYQDSNYVQEYILKSVTSGSNYFMVGDVKQSIYRFRLARPEIFLGKYEEFQEEGEKIRIDLNQNFRSRREVIDSVNDVFEQLMTRDVAGMDYDGKARLYPGAQYPQKGGYGPPELNRNRTRLLMIETDEKAEGEDKSHGKRTRNEIESYVAASEIHKLLEEKFEVQDKETGEMRPICCRDIVVLMRSPGELGECIRRELEKMGIPAFLSAKTGYFASMEIRTILNYLKIIDNPRQDIPLYGSLLSCFGGFTEEEVSCIRILRMKESLYDALEAVLAEEDCGREGLKEKAGAFLAQLDRYRDAAVYTTIHDLLLMIYEETGFLNYMTAFPGGAQRQANLYMLLEKAGIFEQTSYHGLFHFIRYIGQLKEQEVDYGESGILDENADVVRIMTIHKSKGLEFPVCFLCGMGKKINKKDIYKKVLADADLGIGLDYIHPVERMKTAGLKKQFMAEKIEMDCMAEEIRVLYVAMTRAREKLVMTGCCPKAEDLLAQLSGALTPGKILKQNTYLELVTSALLAGGKSEPYLEIIDPEEIQGRYLEKEIKDILLEEQLEDALQAEEEVYSALLEQMEFEYAYPRFAGLYTKTTVSEMKKAFYEETEARAMFPDEEEKEAYVPGFARESAEGSKGTRRGTAYHRMMEIFPFEELRGNREDLPGFVEKVKQQKISEGFISREDADLVSAEKCIRFLQSDLARKMGEAAEKNKLYKEKPFFLGITADELDPDFPGEEYIIVQGVIDAYYECGGGIVIMDYKTDRVSSEDELVRRYRRQLEIYARAVRQITGKAVTGMLIYSFALGKEITL